jgi:hypothetical protein
MQLLICSCPEESSMAEKKACVIYTAAKEAEAMRVAERLKGEGYEVCAEEVTPEFAEAAPDGGSPIPQELAECLSGAEVCIILVEGDPALSAGMGGIGGAASDGGCRVVTVGGNPEALPTELDDIIDGHVPSADTPELIEIANGRPDRIRPDNSPTPDRDEDRVKCQ